MEAQRAQPPSDPTSAAAYPRWAMLEKYLKIKAEGSSCSTSGASETLAVARTSTGHLIHVSLRLAEPPGLSCVRLQIADVVDVKYSMVVAAHGDSVLIEVVCQKEKNVTTVDHFVYNAGAAAADPPRPPSLSLLPPFDLDSNGAGLMRRGEDELVVAQLTAVPATPDTPERIRMAELSLFRCSEWCVNSLQIRFRDDSEVWVWDRPRLWDTVFPVGDGLLCWVDLEWLVILLCDVLEETPRLQFLLLPRDKYNIEGPPMNRNVCATAGGDALKFINIFPRCCCGEAGAACCKRSRHAYTIQTWTMRIDGGDVACVMDGVVDATELWALDAYKGLPRLPLDHPVLSMDEPDLICFWLHEPPDDDCYWHEYSSVDLLMVNMRNKTIHSVSCHKDLMPYGPIPSKVSDFFNNSYRCSSCHGTLTGQRQKKDVERPSPAIIDDDEQLIRTKRRRAGITSNPTLHPASFAEPSVQTSEIFFEAFQEILGFGLDHDEIIKAYRILSLDNCCLFRSFIRLPKNERKDWLSMEIEACKD